ncbi:uncharacterized protein LOC130358450 isoform X2 [Hyla sarda]|uniref:uncharacterized protein LOC130358450 isoform X2 n=1 Tax=Hyla sarda TaxID=327740 RepID=UPI0024C34DD5|nr:uncharacterized protein LOC130358450 isoform X2 [Hyla sarda]
MDNWRRGDSPDEENMRRQPPPPPSSPTDEMMENNAEVTAHLPGQCLEDSVQVLPRVTCQLAQFTISETDSTSSDEDTSSDESSPISPIRPNSPISSIGSISLQVPAPQCPQHIFLHCPGSLADNSSSDEETTSSDEYSPISPISPIRPNSPICPIGSISSISHQPQPRYSVRYPGQVIPEDWFIGPMPELAAMPEYRAMCEWYSSDREAHRDNLVVTCSHVGRPSEATSGDELISLNITCAFNCTITSRPFMRLYRHIRSRFMKAAQRLRRALQNY